MAEYDYIVSTSTDSKCLLNNFYLLYGQWHFIEN